MTGPGICKHPPCERPTATAGWCNAHYIRARKGKDPDNPPLRNRKRRGEVRFCSWKDCQRSSQENGMCQMHAQRQRNGWNMDAPPRVMGQKKPCQQDGCDRNAVSRGYCDVHYRRLRQGEDMTVPIRHKVASYQGVGCKEDGCDRLARANGWCNMHWQRARKGIPKKSCQQDGCDRNAVVRGYCDTHARRQRKGLDMTAPIRSKVGSYQGVDCKQDGCDRPARAKGWCNMHWQRERKGIPLDAPLRITMRNEGQCQWPGCPREQEVKLLCKVHYSRQYQGLDMDAPVEMPKKYIVGRDRKVMANGYVRVKRPGHFSKPASNSGNWYDEHRYMMECHLGRPLRDGENVHHINGDKADNRLENLELWTSSQPAGQRVVELLDWADYIIAQYEPEMDKLLETQLPLAMPPGDD